MVATSESHHRARTTQSHGRRHRRQPRAHPARARPSRGRRRRPGRAAGARAHRISARRSRAASLGRRRVPRGNRLPGARKPRRPCSRRDDPLARRRARVQRGNRHRQRRDDAAVQIGSSQLRRVRREARLHGRTAACAGQFPRCSNRRAGMRRHLDTRHHRAPGERRRRVLHRAERLSVRDRKVSDAHRARPRAHARNQPRAHLRQPDRRPGRARVRRPIVRPQSLRRHRLLNARLGRNRRADALDAHGRRMDVRGRLRRRAERRACRHLQRAHHRPARLRREERLSRNRPRPVRRRRLGAQRRGWRRCAWARARAGRAAAVAVHRRRSAWRKRSSSRTASASGS